MGDFEGCPSCEKPVMGRTALLAHLEFSHDIEDPIGYLLDLEQPARPSRFRRLKRAERRTRPERSKAPTRPERLPPPERSEPEPPRHPKPAERPEASRIPEAPQSPETSQSPEAPQSPETSESPTRFKRPERPARPKRDSRPLLTWGSGALVAVAVVVAGVLAMTGSSADGTDGVPVAAGESASVTSPSEDPAPTSDPPSATATTTAPPTTAPPTTDAPPPTTSAPPTTRPAAGAVALEDFRKPFLLDAHVVTCAPSGAEDVYTVGFTLSGAREIILDGEAFPGKSADGDHEARHAVPAGSTGYLDRITVLDGAGAEHAVDVSPPLYLGGCSA